MAGALDSLHIVRERRADLRAALGGLERALAGPAPGREREWLDHVRASLRELSASLTEHVTTTERDGALFDEIVEAAPRLVHAVERLRTDHDALAASVLDLLGRAAPDAMPADVDDIRKRGVELLADLVAHRHRGSDLVFEAYNVDIEAAD